MWLFVIKFMAMHAWSGLMDTQWQCDLMGLISCACQTKRRRYAQRKQGGGAKKGRTNIWSCKHLETGREVINHATVFSQWAILRSAARGTAHFLPPESNLSPRLHSAGPTSYFLFFFESLFRCRCSSVAARNKCLQCSFPILGKYRNSNVGGF